MAAPKVLNLPTEVQLVFEVMPCQALRRTYEPGGTPHPCAYFGEWGSYHSMDYADAGPPPAPGITQPMVYAGKASVLPEILAGCRKAPILAVGINPNLPGWWPKTRNAVNPLFEDYLQYAHYFRYRSISKLQIPRDRYDDLRGDREDAPFDPSPLTAEGAPIATELAPLTMYKAYQSLLDGLGEKLAWAGHRLAVGEDLAYANMVACPSAKWVVRKDSNNPAMPVMGQARMEGIVHECFHDRKYFLRQLFQSLPAVLLVFSESTGRQFIAAMNDKFTLGAPQPGEKLEDLLHREIRLGYGTAPDGTALDARVVFLPHASANPQQFEEFRRPVVDILAAEVAAGRLALNPATGHLRRGRGGCRFCTNELYRIGPCDYESELQPLADGGPVLLGEGEGPGPVERENAEQARLLEQFLAPLPLAAEVPELLAVDDPESPPLVLRGKVVTLKSEGEVIANGAVYLRSGEIVAVQSAADPVPAGFETAPVLSTEGTIYPGLLDLHNHLVYNVATLWNVPRAFKNRDQWQRHASYRENLTLPMGVLAQHPATVGPLVRYVETKALLGGTTSVQGMRSKFHGATKFFTGAVRNFEGTDDPRLPESGSRIPNLNPNRPGDVDDFRRGLANRKAYFYHLSEGIDAATHKHFENLETHGLLAPSLVAIHCLALEPEDFADLAAAGGKVVWSPLSNALLYGATLDPARLASVPFSIGCDWSPSGGKNLLEEVKVAHLAAQAAGTPLTPFALVDALTRRAAENVGWGAALGTLEAGKYADLLVLDTVKDDPYENLLHATERHVRLVVVAGFPRHGDRDLMNRFAPALDQGEDLVVGGRAKRLYLEHPKSGLTMGYGEAKAKLEDYCARLHELDEEIRAGVFTLQADGEGDFALLLDNDDYPPAEPGEMELLDADLTLPPSIPLDPPTVIDDAEHFARLQAIAHRPVWLDGLAAFYA
jgi:hypothetical protein